MSPPPASDSPSTTSSKHSGGRPECCAASPTTTVARSKALVSRRVPLRAVPIAVRHADSSTASFMQFVILYSGAGRKGDASSTEARMKLETVEFAVTDHVATITLNRPEAMNSFTQRMLDEFGMLWQRVKNDDDIRVVVLRAAGDRAFSTGMDVKQGIDRHPNVW